MSLTTDQKKEIQDLQSQQYKTKRVLIFSIKIVCIKVK